ncbi:MAG: hypothetical protein OEQ13_02230 [Acidobacteriota bacterium]|nr:hypothetical protein [Acidobacteriota bacterium]
MSVSETQVRSIPTGSAAGATGKRASYPRWRRRKFIVDRRYQLQTSLMTVLYVMIPLLVFNVLVYVHSSSSVKVMKTVAPHLANQFERQHDYAVMASLIVSCLFLIGVAYVRVLETHKTAGPAFRLCRALDRLREGRYDDVVRLRSGDNLKVLQDRVNDVRQSMLEREREELVVLERLASQSASIDGDSRRELERLIESKRERLV